MQALERSEACFFVLILKWADLVFQGLYILACYSTSKDIKTFERELNALISLDKVHPLDRMIIVTYDEDRIHKTESGKIIEIIPLWKWLLRA